MNEAFMKTDWHVLYAGYANVEQQKEAAEEIRHLRAENELLWANCTALVSSLREFGNHKADCPCFFASGHGLEYTQCKCGFREAFIEVKK